MSNKRKKNEEAEENIPDTCVKLFLMCNAEQRLSVLDGILSQVTEEEKEEILDWLSDTPNKRKSVEVVDLSSGVDEVEGEDEHPGKYCIWLSPPEEEIGFEEESDSEGVRTLPQQFWVSRIAYEAYTEVSNGLNANLTEIGINYSQALSFIEEQIQKAKSILLTKDFLQAYHRLEGLTLGLKSQMYWIKVEERNKVWKTMYDFAAVWTNTMAGLKTENKVKLANLAQMKPVLGVIEEALSHVGIDSLGPASRAIQQFSM